MRTLQQIFEEHGTDLILVNVRNGIIFDIVKDDKDFFHLIECNNSDSDRMPEEYNLEISDIDDIEESKVGGYYSGSLDDICEIKNFILYKRI